MNIKILTLVCTLVSCFSAHAATISHNGYTLDIDTDIVTGGGLEWSQWDKSSWSAVGRDGWRLADNVEMAALFNAFGFGISFDTDENTSQETPLNGAANSIGPANNLTTLFGDTWSNNTYYDCITCDPFEESRAWFGGDKDDDGLYNLAAVLDEYGDAATGDFGPGYASLSGDFYEAGSVRAGVGLALVREVPSLAAGWLFISALVGLVGKKRLSRQSSG